MSIAPVIVGLIAETPAAVTRRYNERRAAGQLDAGEAPPIPCYRSLMQLEIVERAVGDTNDSPPRYPFVMSVGTPDAAHDVVEQSWDLSRFMQNPVAFLNHNSWGLPIGRWENVRVEGGVLRGDFVPSEAHELARTVRAMLDEKTLRCASVGFVPGQVTDRSKYPTDDPMYAPRGYVYRNNMLIECSVVSVPMHPGATMEERGADPAPQTAAEPAPAAEPPVTKGAVEDGPTFDLDAFAAALGGLFPVSAS